MAASPKKWNHRAFGWELCGTFSIEPICTLDREWGIEKSARRRERREQNQYFSFIQQLSCFVLQHAWSGWDAVKSCWRALDPMMIMTMTFVDDVAPNWRNCLLGGNLCYSFLGNRQHIFGTLIFCSDGRQTMGCLS